MVVVLLLLYLCVVLNSTPPKKVFSFCFDFYVIMQKHCWWHRDSNGDGSLTATSSAILPFKASALLCPFVSISKVVCLLADFILIKCVWVQGCVVDVLFIALQSGAKWSEQQLLTRWKEKPPQGEGYSNGLTLCRQRCRYVTSGFWGEGNSLQGTETVGGWLCVVGVPILCICWQFTLGQWMLENTASGVRAGEWALLYDSTSLFPGSCKPPAAEWNRGQKLISCFAISFLMKR